MKRVAAAILIIAMAALAAGCSSQYVTPKSDTYDCIFANNGSQRLLDQLPPGSNRKKVRSGDTVVEIPASNRFYMAAQDDSIRDPLAPDFYPANAADSVAVQIEGQIRFRFNLPKACQWYSVDGRRNADSSGNLGFNDRGADAANAGWFHFLAENFGLTMDSAVKEVTNSYNWAAMYYDYPVNANDLGVVPKGQVPGQSTLDSLGTALGVEFTKELNANLGDQYFCGVDSLPGQTTACPPMTFQVKAVTPTDSTLIADRQQVEATGQQLQSTQLQGQLQQQQAKAVEAAAAAQQAILKTNQATAEIQAQIDTAKCRALAAVGDDCSGNRPSIIVNGGSVSTNGTNG